MLKCSSLNCPVDFCPGPENPGKLRFRDRVKILILFLKKSWLPYPDAKIKK